MRKILFRMFFVFPAMTFLIHGRSKADVSLPAIFGNHMVLQRNLSDPVWGKADPGEEITVSIAGQTKKTTADADGKWLLKLDPLKEGG
ncbi:MAG: sialate O-acetylesterase, partial [Planctomycetaceae bacterium]|nr:sialate O-acetylesterase [Planctomycetaceae bacterium]